MILLTTLAHSSRTLVWLMCKFELARLQQAVTPCTLAAAATYVMIVEIDQSCSLASWSPDEVPVDGRSAVADRVSI